MSDTEEESQTPPQTKTPAKVIINISRPIINRLHQFINQIDPQVAKVLRIVPYATLLSILECKPKSQIQIIECIYESNENIKVTRFASWTKPQVVPKRLKGVNWKQYIGKVIDQGEHDVCWAFVVVDLIRAIRWIDGREKNRDIEYSAQDLIDFVDPVKRMTSTRENHYIKGMKYVMKKGIEKEEARPYVGCPKDFDHDRIAPQFGCISNYMLLHDVDQMLHQLQYQPIGAALAMFHPDFEIKDAVSHRGPRLRESKLVGMHAVSLVAVGEENGEKYVLAKSTYGEDFGFDGYMKISLEVMIFYIPIPGESIDINAKDNFGTPSLLISDFISPQLFSRKEEKKRKRRKLQH